jgi:hypothetical protein
MATFRLKMATQLGEKISAEFGFLRFPVDPIAIAKSKGIEVVCKPPDVEGVSGAIIFAHNECTIIHSSALGNLGFERFSISHELGHYFIPGHPEEIISKGGMHVSRANFTETSSIEIEADHFASGLLLPAKLTKDFLDSSQIGLDGIVALANEAGCSVTAAAIRAAECSSRPIAVVVSREDAVSYAFTSDNFKSLGKLSFLRKGTLLPNSATKMFNADPQNILAAKRLCDETDLNAWFDGSRNIKLDEEVIGLGRYGFTLTVLSGEFLPEDPLEDEENEDALIESWKPKFAYGR